MRHTCVCAPKERSLFVQIKVYSYFFELLVPICTFGSNLLLTVTLLP